MFEKLTIQHFYFFQHVFILMFYVTLFSVFKINPFKLFPDEHIFLNIVGVGKILRHAV